MATVLKPHPETVTHQVVLSNVSWDTYERLIGESEDNAGTRFNYDRGLLEIMIVSLRHERLRHKLATLVEIIAEELGVDTEGAGSVTFRQRDAERGFEPDACFYFEHAGRMRTRDDVDATIDPPPELVIEVDITSPSLNKLPLYAGLGVAEVWRHDGSRLTILKRRGDKYVEESESSVLSGISGEQLNEWISQGEQQARGQWLREIRGRLRIR